MDRETPAVKLSVTLCVPSGASNGPTTVATKQGPTPQPVGCVGHCLSQRLGLIIHHAILSTERSSAVAGDVSTG